MRAELDNVFDFVEHDKTLRELPFLLAKVKDQIPKLFYAGTTVAQFYSVFSITDGKTNSAIDSIFSTVNLDIEIATSFQDIGNLRP